MDTTAPGRLLGSATVPKRMNGTSGCVARSLTPTITSTPATTGIIGTAYSYTITATDPENDPLTYALVSGPNNMTISGNVISWTPSAGQTGANAVRLTFRVQYNNSSAQDVDLAGCRNPSLG